jgi:catechol 2,3-dioxygenase-like lactoylglutathione lyase family enzyme
VKRYFDYALFFCTDERRHMETLRFLHLIPLSQSKSINHVAVSFTDIDSAMRWYRDVIHMTLLVDPKEVTTYEKEEKKYDPHLAALIGAIFGPKLGKFKFCHMGSANGVGIELFQFLEPSSELRLEENNFDYWKSGYFHICLTEPDIEGLAGKIASTGGKRRTDVMEVALGSGKKFCFCEDPFGNVIEIYSHSYEQFWASTSFIP